jgi:hypothetical protein
MSAAVDADDRSMRTLAEGIVGYGGAPEISGEFMPGSRIRGEVLGMN